MRTTYEYTLSNEEFLRIFQHAESRLMTSLPAFQVMRALNIVVAAAIALLGAMILQTQGNNAGVLAVGVLVVVASYFALVYLRRRGLMQHMTDGCHLTGTRRTMVLEGDGIQISSSFGEAKYFWSGIRSVEAYQGSVALYLDNTSYYPVAAAAFTDQAERDDFLAFVRSRIGAQPFSATATAPTEFSVGAKEDSTPADTPLATIAPVFVEAARPAPRRIPVASIVRDNVNNAFRFAFFMRVTEDGLPVSWWQALCFALLSMAAPVVWALATIGADGVWNWTLLPGALFHVPVLLAAAILIAYARPNVDKTLALFQAFLMIAFAVDLMYYLLFFTFYRLPEGIDASAGFPLAYYGSALWIALASAVAAMRLTGADLNTRFAPLLISGLLIALPLSLVYRDRSLWEQDYSAEKSAALGARNDFTAEDNFYLQPVLLQQELAAVRPQREGVTDVFFIGMAGYGGQDVFRREVDAVTRLFRERFDAEGHTIRLINNPKMAASAPIASVTSLRASLRRVAEVMDRDEDLLVLFLTSHGSEAHRFSLELWPLQFRELDPLKLRALLDESGIRHRVVVVSACYSGGFIDALKDDNTLVITASAPDRNSFGCGNENEWTYFGKAYFDEALRTTHSFTEAFDIARPVIAEHEQKQQFKPSAPQMSIGKNIGATLARLQAELTDPDLRAADAARGAQRKAASDAVARYAALRFDRDYVAQIAQDCRAGAQSTAPDSVVAAQPDAYSGLNPNSRQWPRLVGAWSRYVDTVCDRTSQPGLLQSTYAHFLREASPGRELDALLRFVETPAGIGWLNAEKRANLRMSAELARIQSETDFKPYRTFLEEQKRIYEAFQEDVNRKK